MKKIFFFFFSVSLFCYPQQKQLDSLNNLVRNGAQDTNMVINLNHIASVIVNNRPDSALQITTRTLELARKLKYSFGEGTALLWRSVSFMSIGAYDSASSSLNSSLVIAEKIKHAALAAKVYNQLGQVNYRSGNFDLAYRYHTKAYELRKKLKDVKGVAASLLNIGIVFYYQGNFPQALQYYFASLKNYESVKSSKGILMCYGAIGLVYENQQKFSEALKYHLNALELAKKIGDNEQIANAYVNAGNIYNDKSNYEEAIRYYEEAVKIYLETGNVFGLGTAYYNLGGIYYLQRQFGEAKKYFSESFSIREKIGDRAGLAASYITLADVNIQTGNATAAKGYLEKSLQIGKEFGLKDVLKTAYRSFSSADSALKDYRAAWEHHKMYIVYRDSVDNEESRKKSMQAQVSFDFEKKAAIADAEHKKQLEHEKTLGAEKERKQTLILAFVVAGLVIVLAFAVFVVRSLRLSRKQNVIIESQKVIVEEKALQLAERQKEILDSIHYAHRIQKALITNEKYISKNLARLAKRN